MNKVCWVNELLVWPAVLTKPKETVLHLDQHHCQLDQWLHLIKQHDCPVCLDSHSSVSLNKYKSKDPGQNWKSTARHKNTTLTIKCTANREAMQNTVKAPAKRNETSRYNRRAPNLQGALFRQTAPRRKVHVDGGQLIDSVTLMWLHWDKVTYQEMYESQDSNLQQPWIHS